MKEPLPSRKSTPEGERYQADFVRDFYTLAFSHPGVEAIVWWSVSDKDAWRGMPAGLLGEDGTPKPSYEVLDELINTQPAVNYLKKVTFHEVTEGH
jgi:GH35 family endo-1,4-beta-xylanase